MNCRFFSCIFLFLFCYNSKAQLLSTQKISRETQAGLLKTGALLSQPINVCISPEGQILTLIKNTKGLTFQYFSVDLTGLKEGNFIAPIKKNTSSSITVDNSHTAFRGRIYACWDDEKFIAGSSDIFLAYSDDKGETWTEPILITYHPNHKSQFRPKIAVDTNGCVSIVYYDQQNSADNTLSDVYLAQSKNGGLKFDYYRLNSKPFKFKLSSFIILVPSDPVSIYWYEEKNRMYFSEFYQDDLDEYTSRKANEQMELERTIRFSDTMHIHFNLKRRSRVSAIVTKPLEPGFEAPIIKNRRFKKGKHTLVIDAKKSGLIKGNYTVTLYYNSGNSYAWVVDDN